MPEASFCDDFSPDAVIVLSDMLPPKGLTNSALVLSPNVEKRKVRFSPDGLALEDASEDAGTVNALSMVHARPHAPTMQLMTLRRS